MATAAPASLLRVLGVGFAVAATVGSMVGQGILRTPGIVAGAVPDPTLILVLWMAVGLFCLIDACAMVEMAAATPTAGGPFAFAARAFGARAALITGWADLVTSFTSLGFMSIVAAEYLQRLGLFGTWPTGLLALGVIAVFTGVNLTGTRATGASQSLGSLLKGIGLILLIGLMFSAPMPVRTAEPVSPMLSIAALAVALRAIKNTYNGWHGATYFCEEVGEPGRNLPRSVFGGVVIVTLLYTLVNAALLQAMTPAQIAASNLPAADAMRGVLGDGAERLVSAMSAVSVLAIVNLYIMFSARISFAMARQGVLPGVSARTSRGGTPYAAILSIVVPAALAAASGSYGALVAINAPMTIVTIVSVTLAAWALRGREPDLVRPFRTPAYHWVFAASLAVNAVLLAAIVYEDPGNSLIGFAVIAVAAAVSVGVRGRLTVSSSSAS